MAAATTLPVPSSFLITRWNIFKGKFIREVKGKQNKAPSERTNIKKQTHFQIIALLSFKVHPRLAGSGLGTRSQASICTEAFVWPNYTDLSFKFFCLGLSVRTGMIAGTHGDFEYSPLIPKINANLPLVSLSTFTSSGSCGSLEREGNSTFWPIVLTLTFRKWNSLWYQPLFCEVVSKCLKFLLCFWPI